MKLLVASLKRKTAGKQSHGATSGSVASSPQHAKPGKAVPVSISKAAAAGKPPKKAKKSKQERQPRMAKAAT